MRRRTRRGDPGFQDSLRQDLQTNAPETLAKLRVLVEEAERRRSAKPRVLRKLRREVERLEARHGVQADPET
jgi:hypothetical protein